VRQGGDFLIEQLEVGKRIEHVLERTTVPRKQSWKFLMLLVASAKLRFTLQQPRWRKAALAAKPPSEARRVDHCCKSSCLLKSI
jgi:hypothetical protein